MFEGPHEKLAAKISFSIQRPLEKKTNCKPLKFETELIFPDEVQEKEPNVCPPNDKKVSSPEEEFRNFKTKFAKVYTTKMEENQRFEVFANNLGKVHSVKSIDRTFYQIVILSCGFGSLGIAINV